MEQRANRGPGTVFEAFETQNVRAGRLRVTTTKNVAWANTQKAKVSPVGNEPSTRVAA